MVLRSILQKFPGVERYNQIIWAVIGSGVVIGVLVMVLLGLGALVVSLFHSNRGGIQVAVIEDDARKGAAAAATLYDFCEPVTVHGSPYQLIQVVSDQFAIRKSSAGMSKMASYDGYSEAPAYSACRIHGSSKQAGIVNVIIRNADDNSMQLLLKENAIIQRIEYPQSPDRDRFGNSTQAFPPVGTLYWEIASGDSNSDNQIDELDDMGVYLSNPDGSRLERVSPVPSRVLEKSYDAGRKLLLLRILPDTNHDGVLDDKDKPALIEVDVARRKMVREVLSAQALADMMHRAEPKRQVK